MEVVLREFVFVMINIMKMEIIPIITEYAMRPLTPFVNDQSLMSNCMFWLSYRMNCSLNKFKKESSILIRDFLGSFHLILGTEAGKSSKLAII